MVDQVEKVTEKNGTLVCDGQDDQDLAWFRANLGQEDKDKPLAFGTIKMTPSFYTRDCVYARIDACHDQTPLKTTKLLTDVWKLPEPELIISLHGSICMDLVAGN